MSYYVIIRGPLGSGKSTISEKLADQLDAEHMRIDKILDKLGINEIDENEGCIPISNFIQANEDVIPRAIQQLQKGRIVIFDACFYHKEALEHLNTALQLPHYVFTLKAPVEVCIQRDKERSKSFGEEAARAVHLLVSRFDHGINIDVTGTIDETLDTIKSYLPKL